MDKARLSKLMEVCVTKGKLQEALANKDKAVMPDFLRARVEDEIKNLDYLINGIVEELTGE